MLLNFIKKTMTENIIKNMNRGKTVWYNLDKLRNKNRNINEFIYDINGSKIETNSLKQEMKSFWTPLYQKHINGIVNQYNDKLRTDYEQKFDNRAYRIILQLPINTASSFLKGETGASTFLSKDMKNKI